MFKLLSSIALATLALFGVAEAEKVRYDGHSVVRIKFDPRNTTQSKIVRGLESQFEGDINIFSARDVLINSSKLGSLYAHIYSNGMTAEILHSNYQNLLDEVDKLQTAAVHHVATNPSSSPHDDFFTAYHTNDEIHEYFESLQTSYPTLIKIQNIGQTYEKNDQWAYIVTAPNPPANRPVIVLEGGIHAREWIAHSTVTYIASSLITNFDNSTSSLLNDFVFVFIPVVNVDGYLYTWSTDRNWRKTRTPTKNPLCKGADPNRNWDSHWCEEGASTSPCSDSYCGSGPFSEPCVKNVADFILTLNNVKSFVDFHSYSQLWMSPYGYTASLPSNIEAQTELGESAVAAIKKSSGLVYEEGSIYTIIYPASGSSADWGYDVAGIPFPYGVELRDTGRYGFVLPPDQIVPCGEEILAAVNVMANYILDHQDAVASPKARQPAKSLFAH